MRLINLQAKDSLICLIGESDWSQLVQDCQRKLHDFKWTDTQCSELIPLIHFGHISSNSPAYNWTNFFLFVCLFWLCLVLAVLSDVG